MIRAVPIYDYRCDHCGHVFSAVQPYTAEALERCPSCGKRPRRLLATPAIVFKGGGWYKTDSRTPPKDSTAAEKPPEKPAKGAAEPKAADQKATSGETGASPPKREAASS